MTKCKSCGHEIENVHEQFPEFNPSWQHIVYAVAPNEDKRVPIYSKECGVDCKGGVDGEPCFQPEPEEKKRR